MTNEEVIVEAKGQDNTIIIEKNSNHDVILNLERYYFCELEKIFKSQDFINNLLTMQEWITVNYPNMASYGKANKCQLACQRLIHYAVLKNLKEITGVYNSAISSDIAFETNNAIVNIDSKTVKSNTNNNDFESLFFGPNQSSFKNKNIGVSRNYPGLPVNFRMPSIDILNKKPVLTFFLMLKYTDNGEKFDWYSNKVKSNARFICIPNGELSYLFKNEVISNVKTYKYEKELNKKNKKVDKTHPITKNFNDGNFIPIKITDTKRGFYNPVTKETWLETDIKGGDKIYKQAISTDSCRIDFFTLKDRYDSNQTYWKGVSSWNIFDQDLSI